MEFRTFLNNPNTMVNAGINTMGAKIITCLITSTGINLYFNNLQFILCTVVLYPIIGLIFDIILYVFKDKIWTTLPRSVSSDLEITPEQLLAYAKNLPKIRLMRFLTCWVFMVFVDWDNTGWFLFFNIMITITFGFAFCSIFDDGWLNIFKLTKPKFSSETKEAEFEVEFCEDEESTRRSMECIAKCSNATFPGSSAWFAQQHFNSR